MGTAISLLLLAAGTVLTFVVRADIPTWDLQMTGLVLMVVGAIGLALSVVFWSSWGGLTVRTVVASTLREHHPIARAPRRLRQAATARPFASE